MKAFFKGAAHLLVSTIAVSAAAHAASGDPITSGTVLIPSAVAGAFAVAHAAFPSIFETKTRATSRKTGLPNFPTTR